MEFPYLCTQILTNQNNQIYGTILIDIKEKEYKAISGEDGEVLTGSKLHPMPFKNSFRAFCSDPSIYLKFFLLTLLLTCAMPSRGQWVILTGQIKNAFTRQAIPDVTVTLMRADRTIIQDSLPAMVMEGYTLWVKTDMPRVRQKLIVRVTHKEFETTYLTYDLKNFGRNRQIELPVILMERKPMEIALKGVVVRPTRIKIVQRGDTIVYDANAFNLPEGSMLDDLVRELPGAELKSNGEIFVNGKKVDYLMLNSREFFRGNNQVMLRNLPYYTVNNIKVYNRTTDLSRFLGREAEKKE
jgi:hypothetical protein